jgi:hypothetical protein
MMTDVPASEVFEAQVLFELLLNFACPLPIYIQWIMGT